MEIRYCCISISNSNTIISIINIYIGGAVGAIHYLTRNITTEPTAPTVGVYVGGTDSTVTNCTNSITIK